MRREGGGSDRLAQGGGGGREGEGECLAPIVTTGEGGEFKDGVHRWGNLS